MPKISVGRDDEDREEHRLKGTGILGKHLVGEKEEAHKANPIYFDLARPHVVGVFGKRGTGKCLLPDEKVITDKGLSRIEEIFQKARKNGEVEIEKEDEQLYRFKGPKVQSTSEDFQTGENKIVAAYRKKVDEKVYSIETISGRKITVTAEHPLLTSEGWKCADQLTDQKIGIPRKLEIEFENPKLNIPSSFEKADYSSLSQREPAILEQDEETIKDLADGTGSFHQMVNKTEAKGLIEIEQNTIKVTERGKEELERQKTDKHYRMGKSRPIKIPEQVSPELGEFLALLIAEGHEQKITENNYRLMFVNKDETLKNRFIELGEKLFDLNFSEMDELTIYSNSKALEEFLEYNGYSTGKNSFKKSIPNFIISSSDETVSRFLSTYYECEGNLNRKQVELSTASKNIAEQISYMLLRFGIIGRISQKRKYASNTEDKKVRKYYKLTISGKNQVEKFREEIGFLSKRKSSGIEEYERKSNTNVDTFPCGELIKKARTQMGADRTQISKHKQSLKAYEDGKYLPSKEKLSEIIQNLSLFAEELENLKEKVENNPDIETIEELVDRSNILWREVNEMLEYSRSDKKLLSYKKYCKNPQRLAKPVIELFKQKQSLEKSRENIRKLQKMVDSEIFWDQIEEIEEINYEGWVYDLTVEDNHSFTAGFGGIFCHNSYSLGVLAEELQTTDVANNLSTVLIDPMGIYWSMKRPNDRAARMLEQWDLKPDAFDAKVYIPKGKVEKFKDRGMPYDDTFTMKASDLSATEWAMAFRIDMNSQAGILLERVISKLEEKEGGYNLNDILKLVHKFDFPEEVKQRLENRFRNAEDWGIFGEESSLDKLTEREELSVVDVSVFGEMGSGWSVRALVVGLLAKKVLRQRMTARRLEEIDEMEGLNQNEMPIVWMLIDEAHEFLPANGKTAATNPLLRWVKIGREPGVSLALATQQPAKLHPNALSQADIVLSHRLTAKQDIEALGEIMHTYMRHDINHYIDALPDRAGTALILDDNSERIYPLQIRPRKSWHAGGTPDAFED